MPLLSEFFYAIFSFGELVGEFCEFKSIEDVSITTLLDCKNDCFLLSFIIIEDFGVPTSD